MAQLPPSLNYNHVAMRAVRRIVLYVDANVHLQGELLRAVFQNEPPSRDGELAEFLQFHGLDTGDIIDIGRSEFEILARCIVQPERVIMIWFHPSLDAAEGPGDGQRHDADD